MRASDLKETVLADRHRALGARMVPFAGWLMPVQYTSVIEEHEAVRNSCGIFDVGHMGTIFVRRADAFAFLQRTFTNDLSVVPEGKAQYEMLCNDAGGVIDDLIVSHLGLHEWMVVPNAANVVAVAGELRRLAHGAGEIEDVSDGWGILAVQGPRYREVVDAVLPGLAVGRFNVVSFAHPDGGGVLSGTGYTGSPGVEIVAPASTIGRLWDGMQDALGAVGGLPAGLAARDTLRLEMGYPLHGQDISPTISPLEAGLGWVVKPDAPGKDDFPGASALRRQMSDGPPRRSVGIVTPDRRPPRAHNAALDAEGRAVGEVTSGNYSPGLGRGIGLALVERDKTPAAVDIRGKITPVEVVKPPFVDVTRR